MRCDLFPVPSTSSTLISALRKLPARLHPESISRLERKLVLKSPTASDLTIKLTQEETSLACNHTSSRRSYAHPAGGPDSKALLLDGVGLCILSSLDAKQ